jgi:heat-inducible transcriptional repressor
MDFELNERERDILGYVVSSFITTAVPVGSKYITQVFDTGLSPASVRNTLADLEGKGFITHPHTSAGRTPTDKGYRFFVDFLMQPESPTSQERGDIRKQMDTLTESSDLFAQTARLLGAISHQLSVVSSPHFKSGVLEHVDLISVSSSRIFVILRIQAGIVKTITMEVESEMSQENLNGLAQLLNERICGLTLDTIRQSFSERVKDVKDEHPVINVFIRSADKIFDDTKEREKLHIGGTKSLIEQPEYGNPEYIKSVIELINNEGILVQLLDNVEPEAKDKGFAITIGDEHTEGRLKNYSVIVSTYKQGGVIGSIGVIGPKRMNYQRVVPLVNFIAEELSITLG